MRKRIFYLLLLSFALTISTASAATIYSLYYPHEGRIPGAPELTVYLDGLLWSNETVIQWGDLTPGQAYFKNLTAVNTGNTALTVVLRVQGLPSGWSLTWMKNNTALDPTEPAIANLILTVPISAIAGSYTWDSWIEGI